MKEGAHHAVTAAIPSVGIMCGDGQASGSNGCWSIYAFTMSANGKPSPKVLYGGTRAKTPSPSAKHWR